MKKRLLGLIFTIASLVAVTLPVYGQDEATPIMLPDGEMDYSSTLFEEEEVENDIESIYEYSDDVVIEERGLTSLPSKYVPDYSLLPKLRDQGSFGTCWAHSSIYLMEMNAIKYGKVTPSNIDFSELALAYFTTHTVEDPIGGTAGDENWSESVNGWLYGGGNALYGARAFSTWVGPTSETEYPATAYSKALDVYDNGLSGEYAYLDSVHSTNFYRIASTSEQDAIKALISENGGVTASYYSVGSRSAAEDTYHYYSSENNCYYCDDHTSTNHSIALVGWDDNFSKTNFNPERQPQNDGAWLVRNSWYYDSEAPLESFYGYFWISYDDTSLGGSIISYDAKGLKLYDNNYQYSAGVACAAISNSDDSGMIKAANIYPIEAYKKGEIIEAVSFETNSTNTTASARIYLNPREDKPESGILVGKGSITTTYAGAYTIELDEPVYVGYGDKVSVEIIIKKEGFKPSILVETNQNTWFRSKVTSKPHRSFVYNEGKWIDITEYGVGDIVIRAYTSNISADEEYKTRQYGITYYLNGGKNSSSNPIKYRVTSPDLALSNPATRTGYTFAGWYLDSDFTQKITKISSGTSGDLNLYAKWTPIKYHIVFKGNGSTSGSTTPKTSYSYGKSYTLTKNGFKRKGYTFKEWNTKSDGTGTSYKNAATIKNLTSTAEKTVNL